MRQICLAVTLWMTSLACQSWSPAVSGSGIIVSEARSVEGFHAVKVSGSAEVLLTQGADESLEIDADDNLLPYIVTAVDDGVLDIRFKSGNYRPSQRPIYRIGIRDLDGVKLSGSIRLLADEVRAGDLGLEVSGSGVLKFGQLNAQNVEINVSGSGKIEASHGDVSAIIMRTSGSGDLEFVGVRARRASMWLSGSGSARVWVEEELTARVSGSGEIAYLGRPTVESRISGSGEVYSIQPETK